jgi:NADH dehydrogenase/NADH:ubiquinone oxidoreductase subunit G
MDKCVKCGRCVEVCQEVKKIGALNTSGRSKKYEITTPYKQTLKDSKCDFCGKCAEVCPTGAISREEIEATVAS